MSLQSCTYAYTHTHTHTHTHTGIRTHTHVLSHANTHNLHIHNVLERCSSIELSIGRTDAVRCHTTQQQPKATPNNKSPVPTRSSCLHRERACCSLGAGRGKFLEQHRRADEACPRAADPSDARVLVSDCKQACGGGHEQSVRSTSMLCVVEQLHVQQQQMVSFSAICCTAVGTRKTQALTWRKSG